MLCTIRNEHGIAGLSRLRRQSAVTAGERKTACRFMAVTKRYRNIIAMPTTSGGMSNTSGLAHSAQAITVRSVAAHLTANSSIQRRVIKYRHCSSLVTFWPYRVSCADTRKMQRRTDGRKRSRWRYRASIRHQQCREDANWMRHVVRR